MMIVAFHAVSLQSEDIQLYKNIMQPILHSEMPLSRVIH